MVNILQNPGSDASDSVTTGTITYACKVWMDGGELSNPTMAVCDPEWAAANSFCFPG